MILQSMNQIVQTHGVETHSCASLLIIIVIILIIWLGYLTRVIYIIIESSFLLNWYDTPCTDAQLCVSPPCSPTKESP